MINYISLLYAYVGYIFQDRANKIMASARNEFKKEFNVTFKQTQTNIQGD